MKTITNLLFLLTLVSCGPGPAGTNGIDGQSGPQGSAGPQGSQGPTGATGAAGSNGTSGVGSGSVDFSGGACLVINGLYGKKSASTVKLYSDAACATAPLVTLGSSYPIYVFGLKLYIIQASFIIYYLNF